MRDNLFKVLDALPSKVGASSGFLAMGYATIKPDRASQLLDRFMSAEGIQTFGIAGMLLFAAYWLLWFWLKPKDDRATHGPSQSTNGQNSPIVGSIGDNATFNYGSPPLPMTQERKSPYGCSSTEHERKKGVGWSEDGINGLHRALSGYAPKPDVPLSYVLGRVYKIAGGMPKLDGDPKAVQDQKREHFWRRINLEIADAVVENDLSVWGRLFDRPRGRISISAWRSGQFLHQFKRLEVAGDSVRPLCYSDLMFNKMEIDEVWPNVEKSEPF